jgi:hypothetical protein
MKKFLFLPLLLVGFTYPDFSMCYKKYKNYSIIPISKNYSVTAKEPKKYLKYDENLGLYLIKSKNRNYLHFKKSHLGVWLASIKKGSIDSGNYAEYQKELYTPAKLSTTTKVGAIITDIFCNPIGIGVEHGFLSQKYIKEFITAPEPNPQPLKFIGIIFNDDLVITKIVKDSLAYKHYIKPYAKIVKINNIEVFNKRDIKKVLKIRKNATITIRQDGFDFTFSIKD